MKKQSIHQIRTVAVYQIIGGILGIAFTAWVMFTEDVIMTPIIIRLGLLAFGLYVFSIACGRMLLLNPRLGLKLSIVNQVLQVIYFSFGTYAYQYVAGLRIGVGMDMVDTWSFKFRVALSSFHFNLDEEMHQKFIGINLVAIFLIYWLERLLEQVKEERH